MADNLAEDIRKEIAAFGSDLKAANDNTKRELEQMRSLVDEAGKKVDVVAEERINKFATSIEAKTEALENGLKTVGESVEKVEAILNRPGVAAGWADDDSVKAAKDAYEFHRNLLASEGKLHFDSEVNSDPVAYADYCKSLTAYTRARDGKSESMRASLSTGSDPDGGYMVPITRSDRIVKRVYESSPMRQVATVESIGGKELIIPRDEGEFGYGWIGETESPSETSTSGFGESKIAAHEMYAEPRVTQQMLEDSGFNIEGWIDRKVGSRFARVETTAFFTGNGVNKPRGLLTYANGTTNGKIEQLVSGNATKIDDADPLVDLVFALKDDYTANASWMLRRTTVRDIIKMKDGDGKYIWNMGDIRAGTPSTLLGYNVTRAEDMPVVEAGALAVAFGDFAEAYTIVDRLGITMIRDNVTAKPYVKFYHRRRVGGDVVNFEAVKLLKIAAA